MSTSAMNETSSGARKRVRKPKVKTGCITCKIRRVKCDETHPECLRCQKFGRGYCDGYESTTKPEAKTEKRAILPKGIIGSLISTPRRDPVLQVFKNQPEFSSFRVYCEEVAPQLSFSDKTIWHQLLLQAGQDQPFIRHAIITIGQLNRLLQMEKGFIRKVNNDEAVPWTSESLARDRAFALEHYDKFLRGTNKYLLQRTREEGRRMAMIACLLIVCIENMQYRYKAAQIHANSGLRLLQELKDSESHVDTLSGVPASCMVEEEILDQFNRLELQFLVIYDARTPAPHWRLKTQGSLSIRNMPTTFTSLDLAGKYLILIMRRSYHFMGFALARHAAVLNFVEKGSENKGKFSNLWNHPFIDPERCHVGPAEKITDEVQVEQEIYMAENRRWGKAFEPLLHSALNNTNYQSSHRGILLKLHSLTMIVRLAGQISDTELVYDRYLGEFTEMIRLSKILLKGTDNRPPLVGGAFAFDMGIILPLTTPAMRCRDRKLRREAIQLLRERKLYREFQWPSDTSADVAQFLMEVEEEGVDTYFIPEQARARLTAIHSNVEEKTAFIFCVRGTGENAVEHSSLRDWSGAGAWGEGDIEIKFAEDAPVWQKDLGERQPKSN